MIVTVMSVAALGKAFGGTTDNEINRIGYSKFALIIAVLFVIFILITCLCIKEKSTVDMKNASIGEMFRALIQNDQAMTVVVAIVMINTALYITQQLVYFFLKYDFSPVLIREILRCLIWSAADVRFCDDDPVSGAPQIHGHD